MKTKHVIILSLMCLIGTGIFAQNQSVKTQTVKINKPAKRPTVKVSVGQQNTTNASNERNCAPMQMNQIEAIIRDKVGRNFNLHLDKEYGSIEIMGVKSNIPIEKFILKKPAHNWHYFLNDIQSNLTRVASIKSKIVLKIEFESDKAEIKGKCPGCKIGNDKRAPDLQWKNPMLLVWLKPVAYNNMLTFDVEKVDMMGNLDMNGPMDKFMPVISDFFEKMIREKVEKQIKQTLNRPDIKNMLSLALKPEVDRLRLGRVVSVDDSKDNIYLCNY